MDVGSGTSGAGGASSASGTGLAPNIAAALSYCPALICGVIFMLLEKGNPFVRFHAYQSIIFGAAWIVFWMAFWILGAIIGLIPVIGFIWAIISILLSLVVYLGGFIVWLVLVIKAYQGERWKLPYIGDMAERYAAQPA